MVKMARQVLFWDCYWYMQASPWMTGLGSVLPVPGSMKQLLSLLLVRQPQTFVAGVGANRRDLAGLEEGEGLRIGGQTEIVEEVGQQRRSSGFGHRYQESDEELHAL
jgi:hypothetical protein